MDKPEYDQKMQMLVNDISTYRVLKRDPTNKLQERNNEIVQKMFNIGSIDLKEKNFLTCKNANPPRIYGLPKIHKDDIPLRPICSSIDAPSYNLCKYVVQIFKNLNTSSKYNFKHSSAFKDKIKGTYIYDHESVGSFGVVSLFPSIPVDVAIEIISSRWNDIKEHTSLTKEIFLNMVKFCIKDNRYFKYNNKIYEQRTGMPMGSPASPVLADIVMEELLMKFETDAKNKPRLSTKYVDDIFAVVKTTEIESMLKLLNGYHSTIKFTVQVEKDVELPYLDTLIINKNNRFWIDWYMKRTSSGRLINYNSKQEIKIIRNSAKNFISRFLTISEKIFHKKNIAIIKSTLEQNEFPRELINKLIHNFYAGAKNENLCEKGNKLYKPVSYIPGLAERMKISNLFDREKYTIAFTYNNSLRQVFNNMKDPIPKLEKSNLMYEIPCNGDGSHVCGKVYVGTTKQKLKTRVSGHRSIIKLRNNSSDNKTALSPHCAGHWTLPRFRKC
ncbi:uncharacterized protein [Eurosta solidaginis]|uniref:uncharacterized protein n=1 Tax=Eurosta solidaginis TaxID=178769 RepID=UPI003531057F